LIHPDSDQSSDAQDSASRLPFALTDTMAPGWLSIIASSASFAVMRVLFDESRLPHISSRARWDVSSSLFLRYNIISVRCAPGSLRGAVSIVVVECI